MLVVVARRQRRQHREMYEHVAAAVAGRQLRRLAAQRRALLLLRQRLLLLGARGDHARPAPTVPTLRDLAPASVRRPTLLLALLRKCAAHRRPRGTVASGQQSCHTQTLAAAKLGRRCVVVACRPVHVLAVQHAVHERMGQRATRLPRTHLSRRGRCGPGSGRSMRQPNPPPLIPHARGLCVQRAATKLLHPAERNSSGRGRYSRASAAHASDDDSARALRTGVSADSSDCAPCLPRCAPWHCRRLRHRVCRFAWASQTAWTRAEQLLHA